MGVNVTNQLILEGCHLIKLDSDGIIAEEAAYGELLGVAG